MIRPVARWAVVLALALVLGVGPVGVGAARLAAVAPVPIPLSDDAGFLSDLSAPVLAPGGEGVLSYRIADPLSQPLTDVSLTFELYQFAPAPGGSYGPVPAGALALSTTNRTGPSVVIDYGSIPAHIGVAGTIGVTAGGGAGDGGYTVRTMLAFTEGAGAYRFESRGFFSAAQWTAATLPGGANGTPELNLSALGVDGITPETAVGVHTDPWVVPILVLAGVGIVVAGIGGVYYFRWGPGSRSGATGPEDPQSAPSALGK